MDVEVAKSSLILGERLGSGGQAKGVWRVMDSDGTPSGLVYKEYKRKILDTWGSSIRYGIPSLIRVRSELDPQRRQGLDERAIWPLSVVVEGTAATGVLMRKFPPEFIVDLQLLTGVTPSPNELTRYLAPREEIVSIGLKDMSPQQRARLLWRIALRLQRLHSLGVIVGDFSASNVLVHLTSNAGYTPLMIDCDSYRLNGQGAHLPQPNTPDWQAPETKALTQQIKAGGPAPGIAALKAQREVLNMRTDVYKFGLLMLRLFHTGTDHTMIRTSSSAERALRDIFGASRATELLTCMAARPADRPTMDRVIAVLQGK